MKSTGYLLTSHGNTMIFPFLGETYNGSLIPFFNKMQSLFYKDLDGDGLQIHEKKTKSEIITIMKKSDPNKIEAYFVDELAKISEKTGLSYKVNLEKKYPFTLSVEFEIPKNVSIVAICDFEKCTSHRDKLKFALQNIQLNDEKSKSVPKIVLKNDVFKDFCVFEDYFFDMCLSNEQVGNKSDDYYYGLFTLPLEKTTFLNKSRGEPSSQYKTLEQVSLKALKDFDLLKKVSGGYDINTYPDVWKYLNCNLINFSHSQIQVENKASEIGKKNSGKSEGRAQYRMIPLSLIVAMLAQLNKDQNIIIVIDVCREVLENISERKESQKRYSVYPKSKSANSLSPHTSPQKSNSPAKNRQISPAKNKQRLPTKKSTTNKKSQNTVEDLEFVVNPLTGRKIKTSGKLYQQLVKDKIL